MKKFIPCVFAAVLVLTSLSGCIIVNFGEFDAISGKGDPESFEFRVGSYNGIRIEGNCDIRYYAASSEMVSLEIQPNLRDYFVVEVIGSELVVRTTRRINYRSNTPVLTVSAPQLNSLTINGAGIFTAFDTINTASFSFRVSGTGSGRAELDVENLSAQMSGAGSFIFFGKADSVDLRLSGAGELDALGLDSRRALVNLSGTGTISISCTENLSINASGVGTVSYKGSPRLDLNNSGLITVRKIE